MPLPSLLLIHGPATGAWLWERWRPALGSLGWQVNVMDLRGHGLSMPTDLATVTMEDYVADVASVASQIDATQGVHPVLGGWSTGALVAMLYAAGHPKTPGLLLLSPSLPLEVAGRAPIEAVRQASGEVLGPEAFGVFPEDREASRAGLSDLTDEELDRLLELVAGEQESGIAYRQVLRGMSVPAGAITCPSLVVHGSDDAGLAESLAAYLGGERLRVPGDGRWGIVCHDPLVASAAADVDRWLRRRIESTPSG